MATKTTRQEAYALISYFLKRYKAIYGRNPPGFNRYALAFGFEGLFLDYGDEATELIDYYFDAYEKHDPKKFVNKYGDLAEEKELDEQDAREREALYRKTIKMMEDK